MTAGSHESHWRLVVLQLPSAFQQCATNILDVAHDGPNGALQESPFQRDVHGREQVLSLLQLACPCQLTQLMDVHLAGRTRDHQLQTMPLVSLAPSLHRPGIEQHSTPTGSQDLQRPSPCCSAHGADHQERRWQERT